MMILEGKSKGNAAENRNKTIRKKDAKRNLTKWLGYLIAAYLVASWGVNGVVNPVHYLRNAGMKEEALKVTESTEGFVIGLTEDYGKKEAAFLSFKIMKAKDQSFQLSLFVHMEQGKVLQKSYQVWKGWNSIEIGMFQNEDLWKEIVVPKEAVSLEELNLEDVSLTEYQKHDVKRMVYIFISFLFLAAFWESVRWIKERYTE